MEIEIRSKEKNTLLSREEVLATITFEAQTPSNNDVTKALADNLKSTAEKVVVKSIKTHFGDRNADVTAFVYDSKEKKVEIEPKKKEKKAKPGESTEAPKEGAKPADTKEAKEEKPAEPAKDKPEEKKE
tara:strand:+ start:63 stop:449 length:387 start_codon:yes stop_codon:yes gene_type:complete